MKALTMFCCLFTIYFYLGFPSACAYPETSESERALHVLNRLTYGARPGDLQFIQTIGVEQFIEQQLHPESMIIPQPLIALAQSKPVLTLSPTQMFVRFGRPALNVMAKQNSNTDDAKKEVQRLIGDTYKQLYFDQAEFRLNRDLYSPQQLQELMTEFWFNHFNITFDKGRDNLWVSSYENVAIRPYALGKFRDLLGATAHHAAMLFYLDNWQNSGPNSRRSNSKGRSTGINENYARELMELHTLGVDGGYSQKDVIALAHILTGLGLPLIKGNHYVDLNNPFGDFFNANRHDFSDKVFLGKTIKGAGEQEIEQALDILAYHPATAHHICLQLAQFFICDNPPAILVDKMSKTFLATEGDIKAVLKELFHSTEFWDNKYYNVKFKSPYRYIISALRATNANVENIKPIVQFLRQQGMPLYQCLTPDGYKNTQETWLNPDALIHRLNFATAFGVGRMPNIHPKVASWQEVVPILGKTATAATLNAINQAPARMRLSLVLGSPEFMQY